MAKLFQAIMRKVYEKLETKMAGFIETEVESSPTKHPEQEKLTEYKDFIDAFRQLPWLYAGATALAIASTKPKLRVKKEEKDKSGKIISVDVTGEDINNVIKRPNKFLSYRELIQITIINKVITGNGFWNLVGTKDRKYPEVVIDQNNPPVEIWWIKPEQIDIKSDAVKFIDYYEFTSSTSVKRKLDVSEIIHFKLVNPDSYFRGLGALEPAKNTAILEFNAVAYNKAFLENRAVPDGLFTSNEKYTEEQGKRIVRGWKRRHKGSKKAGGIDFLFGGIHFEELGKSPKDAQYIEMRKMNREEMLACLPGSVPPSIVGLLEYANYSNMEVQSKKFWEDCAIPILNMIADKLTLNLAPLFDESYYFEFDYSDIKVLQEDEKQKAETATSLVSHGIMSRNEVRDRYYNLPPRGGLDAIYLPLNLVAVEGSEQEATKDIKQITQKASKDEEEDEKRPSFWAKRKEILWKDFIKRVESKEKNFITKLEEFLKEQAKTIKEKIAKVENLANIKIDHVFNEEKEIRKYIRKFRQRYIVMAESAGQAGYAISEGKLFDPEMKEIFKEEKDFTLTPEMQQKIDEFVLESGTEISRTTLEKILKMLKIGTTEDWTVEELTQELYKKLSDLSVTRARTIARTETAKLENFGQLEGYKQNPNVELKGWLSAFTSETRQEHMDADAQYSASPIPLNDPFIVGGEQLQFPGDPAGSAGNIINCLCTTFPEVREL